jgi:glycosyltransferase involved in cell wall biosynthesis
MKAQAMVYPCIYDELFCIAVAEAQYAGIYTITTSQGALETTNMGTLIKDWNAKDYRGDEHLANLVVSIVDNPDFSRVAKELQQRAAKRFSPKVILEHWDKKVFQL